ncbi:DUF3040 domain-containing protein [Paenarthrobacter sp. S56]|uniref:DUF3040 domain-containing protein n=1 Tax=Paenarthrobacter sp. S56 TaxID=3138179 RepID=UPI00321B4770
MSLSEEERRSLEELERGLAATDPDLDLQLKSGRLRGSAARTVMAILALIVGFGLVITGIITQIVIVGVLGFLVAGGGAYLLITRLAVRRRLRRYGQGGPASPGG